MLAGCLVNGILSVISVDVISVSSPPTLRRRRSDGKIQNREEEEDDGNDGHSFDGKIGFY